MANRLYDEEHVQNIANAIRSKLGGDNKYKISEMANTINNWEFDTPSIQVSNGGLITSSANGKSNTKQLNTQPEATIVPTKNPQIAVSSGKYTTGNVAVGAIPDNYIVPDGTLNIIENGTKNVTNYASVNVSVPIPSFTTEEKTVNPTEETQTVTPSSGKDGLSKVTVNSISETYVGSGITKRGSTDLTVDGKTVSVPSGYYSSQATISVATGSVGTPSVSKGTVTNHQVTITPSVTNVTGYITGGTKTGTGVTVSASELVSGSQTITENKTVNVTNLAEIVVNIPYTTIYKLTSVPSDSEGNEGDICVVKV